MSVCVRLSIWEGEEKKIVSEAYTALRVFWINSALKERGLYRKFPIQNLKSKI